MPLENLKEPAGKKCHRSIPCHRKRNEKMSNTEFEKIRNTKLFESL